MEHLKDFSLLSFRIQSNDVLKAIETPIPAKAIERLQQAKPGKKEIALYQQGKVYIPLIVTNFVANASACLICRSCLQEIKGYNRRLKAENA